jgi:hypothetical protein
LPLYLKTVNDLFASGATIVNIHHRPNRSETRIEFYGKEVLPKLRR